jgi:hypothetical protein
MIPLNLNVKNIRVFDPVLDKYIIVSKKKINIFKRIKFNSNKNLFKL